MPNLSEKILSQLAERQIQLEFNEEELKRIPAGGPFILLSNRFMEGIDELLLLYLAEKSGRPVTLFPNGASLPREFSGYWMKDILITKETNRPFDYFVQLVKELKKVKWKENGLGLVVNFSGNRIRELRRGRGLNRLVKALRGFGLPIVPVRIYTPEAIPLLGPRIMQFLRPGPVQITLRLGNPIKVEDQKKIESNDRFRRFIQSKIYALGTNLEVKRFFTLPTLPLLSRPSEPEPLAEEVDPALIAEEIGRLTFRNLVASQGEFDILVAESMEIPNTLLEIGRLRELTFRKEGEGTGKSRDIDEYDLYYHQLIIWDREARRIAGGYRMGKGDEIFSRLGLGGFYISSLFRIKSGFYPIMKQSMELGRSYIVPDYQKKRLPLFLLWKGILFYLLQNPQYRYLYGPVSVSKYYSNISKSLIVAFIKKYYFDDELAVFLKPRKPFKAKLDKIDIDVLTESFGKEIKTLDHFIEDIEPEHFRMPVLMRQYVRLNARFISFNVDPQFSDVLDGFIILDLQDVPYSMIEALKGE
ncbi:MAG: lysophospholipid acyltransferase family protein [Saprospirales bacterium]|nr:lysophospholipid acyltransferase family protein [Saprospirales bacterium]MBK6902523.1 lysophospholipid acyltransferase family protein [Saprospirales bacterium]MBK7335700.1 lysophospholipid acyltransferase family protein [Saprospirales bacterium]